MKKSIKPIPSFTNEARRSLPIAHQGLAAREVA